MKRGYRKEKRDLFYGYDQMKKRDGKISREKRRRAFSLKEQVSSEEREMRDKKVGKKRMIKR